MKERHITADVVFVPPEQGGRAEPPQDLNSGAYRPHLHVEKLRQGEWNPEETNDASDYLGVSFTGGPKATECAELYRVRLALPYGVDYSALVKGCTFTIREGSTAVGFGVVIEGIQ